tara:strand:+ start:708 stop:1595 length:888 start_codon:yes stop_codon:yes gene_type:complete
MAIKLHFEQEKYAYKKYLGNIYFTGPNLNYFQKKVNFLLICLKKIKTKLISYKNETIKVFYKPKKLEKEYLNIEFKTALPNERIIELSDILYNQKFIFIENFMSEKAHQALIDNWPQSFFFNPMGKIIKEYNWGFRAKRNLKNFNFDSKDFTYNPVMKKFYNFLSSDGFSNVINNLFKKEGEEYLLYSILSTTARKNSFLIPHVDNVQKTERNKTYNCIYFVDGDDKDLENAGATSIYKDNNFKDLIFQPTSLKNSILIYNSTHNFFHGFKEIKNDITERKTVNFQFHPRSQIKN